MGLFGNIEDVAEGIKIVFLAALVIVIVSIVISNFQTKLATNPGSTAESAAAMVKFANVSTYWDWGVLFIAIGLILISVMVARVMTVSPALLVLMFIVMAFMLIGSAFVSNLYGEMISNNADFAVEAAKLPITQYIINNLVQYAVVYTIAVSVALFTKQD